MSDSEEHPLLRNNDDYSTGTDGGADGVGGAGKTSVSADWICGVETDISRDFNKNVIVESCETNRRKSPIGAIQVHMRAYWSILLKKKRIVSILIVVLLLCYVNTSLMGRGQEDRIPVIHHSHVPGMRAKIQLTDGATSWRTRNLNEISSGAPPIVSVVTERYKFPPVTNSDVESSRAQLKAETTPTTIIVTTIVSPPTKPTNVYFNNNSYEYSTPTMPPPGYLVWSEKCKMPNIDPYLPEVMEFFKREKYEPCSTSKPLTKVQFNVTSQRYVLEINEDLRSSYTKSGGQLDCCYQRIERSSTGKKADKEISLSACLAFRQSVQLANSTDNILVKCKSKNKQTYINGHAMMPARDEIQQRLKAWKQNFTDHPTSVLMIGIDSISRVNLIRAMPKTAQYLYDNEWFEMSGYNKIDDNTFPNLMAVLTGYNQTNAFQKCSPRSFRGLDNCPFIWKTFREHGYVTAYAEDEASINTFNYLKVGFEKPPVDYYLRPFLLSAEKNLTIKRKTNLIFCLGYQHSADYIYDFALELATRYKDDPYFGLFWANTFSHNAISDCSSMDDKMVEYLQKFSDRGILDRSIVIFFSDHGIRFGPTRKSLSGHLEERLPFMFIWLPPHLKNSHPQFVNALSVNKNRLTNPYDLHMTLKHILELTGRVREKKLPPAEDCPNCQTLLRPVSHNRSCEDVSIEDHWCTCIPYQNVYKNSNIVKKLAKASVDYINDYVANFKNGSLSDLCIKLKLGDIQNAYRAQQSRSNHTNQSIETYRIVFYTTPNKALFEATVRYNLDSEAFHVTGEISRLNTYSSDSSCVSDGGAKKYCSCAKKKW